MDAAQRILRACGGLAGLAADTEVSPDAVADWAEVSWYLSGLDDVLAQLDEHFPQPPQTSATPDAASGARWEPEWELRDARDRVMRAVDCRTGVHARCFDLAADIRDTDAMDTLTGVIDSEASASWRARVRLVRARLAIEDGADAEAARWLHDLVGIDSATTEDEDDDEDTSIHAPQHAVPLNLRLAAAELLTRCDGDATVEIDALVPAGTSTVWPSIVSSTTGLDAFRTTLDLLRLRAVHPDPTLATAPPSSVARGTGDNRFRHALQTLAELEALQLKAAVRPGEPLLIAAYADPVIRVLEVPLEQTRHWTGWYGIQHAAVGCFERLVHLAAGTGDDGNDLRRVLAQFNTAWTTPGRAQYWPPRRRQAVVTAVLETGTATHEWACEQLDRLDTEIDGASNDPHDRSALWLIQAKAWTMAGKHANGRRSAQQAVRASAGIGTSDKDDQLAGRSPALACSRTGAHRRPATASSAGHRRSQHTDH